MNKILKPIHPGAILTHEFLAPLGVTEYRLAVAIAVPPRRINEITHGTRAVTADTALRLAKFFNTSPQFWLNLQSQYDLETHKEKLHDTLEFKVKTLQAVI
jgi:addiction module HigA family antidote